MQKLLLTGVGRLIVSEDFIHRINTMRRNSPTSSLIFLALASALICAWGVVTVAYEVAVRQSLTDQGIRVPAVITRDTRIFRFRVPMGFYHNLALDYGQNTLYVQMKEPAYRELMQEPSSEVVYDPQMPSTAMLAYDLDRPLQWGGYAAWVGLFGFNALWPLVLLVFRPRTAAR